MGINYIYTCPNYKTVKVLPNGDLKEKPHNDKDASWELYFWRDCMIHCIILSKTITIYRYWRTNKNKTSKYMMKFGDIYRCGMVNQYPVFD